MEAPSIENTVLSYSSRRNTGCRNSRASPHHTIRPRQPRLIASGNYPVQNRPVATISPSVARTEAMRRFNRFYTRRIGVLHENLAATPFSLTQSRLLWEFAHRERTTAAELARDL